MGAVHITSKSKIQLEAILACHPALSTEWLDWVAKLCELWCIHMGLVTLFKRSSVKSPPFSGPSRPNIFFDKVLSLSLINYLTISQIPKPWKSKKWNEKVRLSLCWTSSTSPAGIGHSFGCETPNIREVPHWPLKVSRDTFHFPWKRKFSFFSR